MKNHVFARALAYDEAAQRQLIDAAYETKDKKEIDTALIHVATVRRMKSSGIFDLFSAFPDDDPEGPLKLLAGNGDRVSCRQNNIGGADQSIMGYRQDDLLLTSASSTPAG